MWEVNESKMDDDDATWDVSVFVILPNDLISQTLWPFPFPKFHQQAAGIDL